MLAACALGIPLRLIADLTLQQPYWDGLAGAALIFRLDGVGLPGELHLAGPRETNLYPAVWIASQIGILLIEAVVAGFAGGVVSGLINRSHQVPTALLTCVPWVALQIALREHGVAGEAASYLAAMFNPVAAALGALAARRGWIGRPDWAPV